MSGTDVLELARPDIRGFEPYSSARMEAGEGALMLNANESAWPSRASDRPALNRYPDPQPGALRDCMAGLYGVATDQVLMTRGSDEGMDLLVRAFCRAGKDAVLISPPTFGMYAVCARVQDAGVVEVPLDDNFNIDVSAVLNAATPAVKLVFVCSPNNPTGNLTSLGTIARLAASLSGRALLVVDEAYIEFSEATSAATLLDYHANLVVLRTLSKAWGLAAARVGALLAQAEVVTLLRRILAPYPLPTASVDFALHALRAPEAMRQRVEWMKCERARMTEALWAHPAIAEVLPSAANFLALYCRDAQAVWERLQAAGIVVRDLRRYPRLDDALRITVGRAEENNAVLAALNATSARVVQS